MCASHRAMFQTPEGRNLYIWITIAAKMQIAVISQMMQI